jgi:Capsular polysaccharide synthesis protein
MQDDHLFKASRGILRNVIWQYWETRGHKPAFIEGLHQLALRNSGCEVVLVTPENLRHYLPQPPREVLRIRQIAHKADMIRSMLLARHGGMWLDSDAIVLHDLNWLFELLQRYEFVCFNDQGRLSEARPGVRVNCFLSRSSGVILREWVRQQHAKFPRTKYGWTEIGTDLLHPICLAEGDRVKVLPFEMICPISWDRVAEFERRSADAELIVEKCPIVMLSNASLATRAPALRRLSCQQIAEGDHLLAAIMRAALRGNPVDGLPGDRASATDGRSSWFTRVLTMLSKSYG